MKGFVNSIVSWAPFEQGECGQLCKQLQSMLYIYIYITTASTSSRSLKLSSYIQLLHCWLLGNQRQMCDMWLREHQSTLDQWNWWLERRACPRSPEISEKSCETPQACRYILSALHIAVLNIGQRMRVLYVVTTQRISDAFSVLPGAWPRRGRATEDRIDRALDVAKMYIRDSGVFGNYTGRSFGRVATEFSCRLNFADTRTRFAKMTSQLFFIWFPFLGNLEATVVVNMWEGRLIGRIVLCCKKTIIALGLSLRNHL